MSCDTLSTLGQLKKYIFPISWIKKYIFYAGLISILCANGIYLLQKTEKKKQLQNMYIKNKWSQKCQY